MNNDQSDSESDAPMFVPVGEDSSRPIDPTTAFRLEEITAVLVAIAGGDFSQRAHRSLKGDPWDVLAFLVNETAEEVRRLVDQLNEGREKLRIAHDALHQAEKLAALGDLAGGVAHELNQPLTVMQSLSELLLEKPEATVGQRRRELELIGAAAKRMGRVVAAVRTFGRKAPLSLALLSPRVPIDRALLLFSVPLEAEKVEAVLLESDNLPLVFGDVDALEQVFINLLSNSRDALLECPPDHPRRVTIAIFPAASGVRITFEDNGPGITPNATQKVFDPFFSTKTVGRGTGLGLAISHGIVAEHDGSLTCEPSSSGARFVLDLPGRETMR